MRKITAWLPARLVADAQACTGEGVTETLKQALEKLALAKVYDDVLALEGKVFINFDNEASRDDRNFD
ncbi:MAG: hypothetical protein JOZ27_04645 [Caulobacteraceae bacterium]|nr:hypothetical protein [Caulobacteraceae bacterium]